MKILSPQLPSPLLSLQATGERGKVLGSLLRATSFERYGEPNGDQYSAQAGDWIPI